MNARIWTYQNSELHLWHFTWEWGKLLAKHEKGCFESANHPWCLTYWLYLPQLDYYPHSISPVFHPTGQGVNMIGHDSLWYTCDILNYLIWKIFSYHSNMEDLSVILGNNVAIWKDIQVMFVLLEGQQCSVW